MDLPFFECIFFRFKKFMDLQKHHSQSFGGNSSIEKLNMFKLQYLGTQIEIKHH